MSEVFERLEAGHGRERDIDLLYDVSGQHPRQVVLRARRRRGDAGDGRDQALPRRVRVPRHAQALPRQPAAAPRSSSRRCRRERAAASPINGRTVEVPAGTLVTDAARVAEVHVPIFCSHDKLPPLGACRICVVEVGHAEARPRPQAGAGRRRHARDRAGCPRCRPAAPPRSRTACTVRTESADGGQGAQGRDGVPARQPPARLPGVRRGRRVPASGSGLRLRRTTSRAWTRPSARSTPRTWGRW